MFVEAKDHDVVFVTNICALSTNGSGVGKFSLVSVYSTCTNCIHINNL